MYLIQSYEDKGGKGPGSRDSPDGWFCVAQKAIDQVLANLLTEERATQNSERVQMTLAFRQPVTLATR